MKKCIHKSIVRTSMGFIGIILFCVASLIDRFSYVDLAYLIVVIGFFVAYLKIVKEKI